MNGVGERNDKHHYAHREWYDKRVMSVTLIEGLRHQIGPEGQRLKDS